MTFSSFNKSRLFLKEIRLPKSKKAVWVWASTGFRLNLVQQSSLYHNDLILIEYIPLLNFAIRRPANHAVFIASSDGIGYYDEAQHDEAQYTYRKRTPQTATIVYSILKKDKAFVLYE